MNLDGSAVLPASPEQVWSVVTDPAVLARAIPGCESLERAGEDSYTIVVSAGVGAVRGKYSGEVRLSDLAFPKAFVMHASGSGGPGSVRATVQIGLEPVESGTELSWSADAVVGGAVAGVGQRMITGVARRLAAQFFTAVDAELTGTAPAAVEPPQVTAGPADAAAPQVFTGRTAAVPGDVRSALLGAAGGALGALLGVAVGYLLGRRR
jgi:uncharacterized protein